MLSIFVSLAEYDSETILQKIKAGQQRCSGQAHRLA
jgi:hypothetical protein